MRRVTGLNTSATGSVEYTSESNQRSHDIRNEKLHHVRRALLEPEIIGEPEGDLLMVGWGSSRGVLEESVKNMESLGVSAMHLKIVYPLPLHLKETFSRFKKVVTVEMAYADSFKETPFAILLRNQTLIDIQCLVAGASGRPLKPSHVIKKVKDCLNGVIA
jgi:2-oxoglutarate ferredoxin oxidoreductase subunit alpha